MSKIAKFGKKTQGILGINVFFVNIVHLSCIVYGIAINVNKAWSSYIGQYKQFLIIRKKICNDKKYIHVQ
jgi:hypothetical protein